MSATTDLAGHVALVTGAARGIGKAIALALAQAGADVAVNYRERMQDGLAVADAVRGLGRRAMAIPADVSDAASVADLFAAVECELGAVDLLVNNAGIAIRRSLDDLTEADFDRTIAVNLKSVFLCTQAALPHMRARRWGRIVNISSGAARGAGGIGLHYNASKAGMEGLTVNAVAPTLIETDMVPPSPETAARIPAGRLGHPDEVAHAVLMAMGNAYMTGQT